MTPAKTEPQRGKKKPLPERAAVTHAPHQDDVRSWASPKAGDLLRDVLYLQQRVASETNETFQNIYARAAIVMAVATIDAITNDALASIYELLTNNVPDGCAGKPPWSHFIGRSTQRIALLLRKGPFPKKRNYVLGHIKRITGHVPEAGMIKNVDQLVQLRNRIVHTSLQSKHGKNQPILEAGQAAAMATIAKDGTQDYVDFLTREFAEIKLPIETTRSSS